MGAHRLFTVPVSTGWDPKRNSAPGNPGVGGKSSRPEKSAWIYFSCYCLGEYETATAQEMLDRQTCLGRGGADGQIPSGGGPRSDRRSG